ncbi:MAG: sigma-70 family RNA polymerase sigma factor [Candidatus Kapabacteria bacterium]|nr:sigma-70 family RNA polymerase sigma factor [Candidatus Kapabacteria bacterium]
MNEQNASRPLSVSQHENDSVEATNDATSEPTAEQTVTETPIPREPDADCLTIQDILAGNTNAFAILQKKYNRQITSLLRRMVREPDDVADLVQETFIKAYRALATFQCEHSFEKWLYKIASNNCIDYLRRKRFQMVSIDKPIGTGDGGEIYMEIPDPHSPQPDAGMLGSERSAIIREAFNSLPEKYQEVIRMRHEEELEYNEIAEKLDLPLGTVKAHIFRARQMMYKKLQKHSHLFNR